MSLGMSVISSSIAILFLADLADLNRVLRGDDRQRHAGQSVLWCRTESQPIEQRNTTKFPIHHLTDPAPCRTTLVAAVAALLKQLATY